VVVIAAATIWSLFSCFLIFPLLGFPPAWHRVAMLLLALELVALMFWSYGSDGCSARPCAPAAEAGRTAAMIDVPLLTLALVAFAVVRGVRHRRA
jgi:hypothetical protein